MLYIVHYGAYSTGGTQPHHPEFSGYDPKTRMVYTYVILNFGDMILELV